MKPEWKILPNLYNALISHKEPVFLTQFVTQRCNAKCPHCFVDFTNGENELTTEQTEKIASSSGSCLRNISLTGGETFLREDLSEIAEIWYKNSAAKSIVVTTNGSMPSRIEKFAKYSAQRNLPVSFFISYDFIGEKHSEYRKLPKLHENVAESCRIIKSFGNKFNLTLQLTVTPDTYPTAFETYKYIRDELKISNINCTMIRGKKADIIEPETRKKLSETYKRIQLQSDYDFDNGILTGFGDKSLTSVLINAKNKMLWKYILKTFDEQKYISPCSAGSLFGIIYQNGDVFPCELLDRNIGNLKDFDYNFMKLWKSINAKKIRKEIICSKCFCTFECSWLSNIFSSPGYYPEILYNIIKNVKRKNNE